ncbi:hypothetical protein B0J13DRAFT_560821 [Dactylonectria estremocensis]|uniref:Uncharacterized protein n=1 Tax=Dactylonectria estremocensis TaxID=1079267 RepID=A0A9P9EBZ6_9HYPO|nr:hypothetical protein B0J13DRAFT_560821 [Dactylonectria estremocensis]
MNPYSEWAPSNISRKPVPDGTSPYHSPTAPQTPWMGHSTTFFTQPGRSDTGYPSSIWEPVHQTRPQSRRANDSHTGLLRTASPDPPPSSPEGPRGAGWLRRHWTPAWSMYAFLLAGIAFACGHHGFYNHLHGKEADDQLRKLRYGTALAFFAKASFVTAAILAYRQRVWMMVREKILSLGAVDSLFAAAEDLTALFHWEAFKSAKVAMCLAIYIWATPLVVILTSETLSVVPKIVQQNTTCAGINTLNFTHEETNDFRLPKNVGNGLVKLSVSTWNTTTVATEIDPKNSTQFDYWTSSSQQFKEVAMRSQYLQQAVSRQHAGREICGKGWNCSFTIEFDAPSYKCEELASGIDSPVKKLGQAKCPFNTSAIVPKGDLLYLGRTDQGDYGMEQIFDVWPGGIPKEKPPFPKNLGAFRTEPLLWIGFAVANRTPSEVPPDKEDPKWSDDVFIPKIIGCEHYKAHYTVKLNYTNSIQSHQVKRKLGAKVIDTRFLPKVNRGNAGLRDNTTATPQKNYVYPKDLRNYRRTAAYHSFGKQLRDILNGTIAFQYKIANTRALETRLVRRNNYVVVDDFEKEVERFYEEMILSLLSDPQFLAVSWARNPSKMAMLDTGGENLRYPCMRERTTNVYFYHRDDLWVVYSFAILMAIIAVVFGVSAMRSEYVVRDTRFSSIVAATRGQSLNRVQWEEDRDVKKVKVGFGLVPDHGGESKYGFGLEGDVSQHKAEGATRSPVIQLREWGGKRASRMFDTVRTR